MASRGASDGGISRRRFLGGALAAGAGLAAPHIAAAEPPATATPLPTRPFGKTGERVTTFGLGCYYVGAAASDKEGRAVVERALEKGVTYFDTAPSYVRGASERRVGLALERVRDRVFLSTKTLERKKSDARKDLEASLKRLKTDRVDLVQVHCVRDAEDLKQVLSEDGPVAALVEAKEKGLVRFVGVTGHEDPEVMKAALERYAWDSVLLPLNVVDAHWKSFVAATLPTAVKQGIGRVAMKVFASGALVGEKRLDPETCLRFAFGLDVSCAIVGCSTKEEVDLAARVAAEAKPLSADEAKAAVARAKPYSGPAPAGVEWYKRAG